ncbi:MULTISPECIES: hypothetical protein [Xanthocytophaga]|uniref:DUF4890 domain-containing protein n=1 Tax=Xanthocytophaga agilis TaxID=3048010 RepID=A0AAE3R7H0_9BACT|nr:MULTISPECIES: hypothetical protein [Xanthocytophaga]MDJ1468231.1 hypothetical protein [Xanthocytophaga flavus]MDJ1505056.1 hypothetical protein [Xanthocytophaga agilis]
MKFSLKKQHVLVVALMLLTTISFAQSSTNSDKKEPKKGQGPARGGEKEDRESAWMKQNLKLTDDQYAKVSQLNKEYETKMRPEGEGKKSGEKLGEKQGGKPSAEDQKKMEKFQAEKETKLKGILTEQQWNDYQAKKKDMHKGHAGQKPEGQGQRPEGKKKPAENQ